MNSPPGSNNGGATQRSLLTAAGKIASFECSLHHDVTDWDKLILSNVPINIKLHQSADAFRLIAKSTTEKYSVNIHEIKMKVCHVRVSPLVTIAHDSSLDVSPAIYSYFRSSLKTYDLAEGSSSFSADNILNGIIPSKCVVCFVESSSYAGSYSTNPFNMVNLKLNFIELLANGQSVPQRALTPNFETDDYIECFNTIFYNKFPSGTGNWISRTDYKSGYTFYVFNVSGQLGDNVFGPVIKGHTRLNIKFAENLSNSCKAIIYCKYPDQISITKQREVLLE